MRHTDVLLKHRRGPSEEEKEIKAEESRQLDQMAAEAHMLQELSMTPGWKLFQEACKADELTLMGLMEQNPQNLPMLCGSLLTARSFQTWAEDRARDLLNAIEQAKE